MDGNEYRPRFTALSRQDGIRVDDPVEDVQFSLYAPGPVRVQQRATDAAPWCFPIDSAAHVDTNELRVPIRIGTYVRNPNAEMVASAANDENLDVPFSGRHIVEFTSTPIKLFVYAESSVDVTTNEHRTTLRFPDVESVHLAARSLHKQPARTITTPRDPESLMRAVSEFGAALKTTTCERSFPTLRGHPPLVEFGDELSIPGGERRPDTGVRLEVPPEPEYVFPTAPLAYYFGAEVAPATTPRLTTRAGVEYEFDPDGFAADATRLLRHVFTLDCLTRVEGYYPVDLDERRRAAEHGLDLDWAALYDEPLAEQLGTYLSVPFDDVEPLVPEWRLTADVVPELRRATVLPHLANELATVRIFGQDAAGPSLDGEGDDSSADIEELLDEFVRAADGGAGPLRATPRNSDAGSPTDGAPVSTEDVIRVPETDTATQTYIGDGFPLNANKGSRASYERQLTLRADTPGRISVTVVCNDDEMVDELEVGDHYGTRDLFDFDVTIHSSLTRNELREVLTAETDLVHYIGHVDQRGLQATDGYLDARTVDDIGTTAFVLNGCRSFRQGQALVDAGAIAGIVTLENVHNSLATEVGTNIARLLNRGWPLDMAVELVKDDALVGRHYIVIGDGSVEIASSDSGHPTANVVDHRQFDSDFDVTVYTYTTRARHLGSMYVPFIGDNQSYYLASGELDTFTVTPQQLEQFLTLETEPVHISQERGNTTISLRWSDELDVEAIRALTANEA
jgi:hypothetical protein